MWETKADAWQKGNRRLARLDGCMSAPRSSGAETAATPQRFNVKCGFAPG